MRPDENENVMRICRRTVALVQMGVCKLKRHKRNFTRHITSMTPRQSQPYSLTTRLSRATPSASLCSDS